MGHRSSLVRFRNDKKLTRKEVGIVCLPVRGLSVVIVVVDDYVDCQWAVIIGDSARGVSCDWRAWIK